MSTNHQRGFRLRLRKLRRGFRDKASRAIAQYFGTAKPVTKPLETPRRILICRLNKRIGNVLFLTPLIQSLARTFPEAEIEVLIRESSHRSLLSGLPGVVNVYAMPKTFLAGLSMLRRIRHRRFDLAIDPMPHSESDRFALLLCGAHAKMGFAAEHQWLKLDHAAFEDPAVSHEALRPLALLNGTIDAVTVSEVRQLRVLPSSAAQNSADELWSALIAESANTTQMRLAFFAEATGQKSLRPDWWCEWIACILEKSPGTQIFQLMRSGDEAKTLMPQIRGFAVDDLEVLAALLAKFDGFTAADSGPMHLAAASGVPVFGVFGYTSAENYAPLGFNCDSGRAVDGPTVIAEECLALFNHPN